MERQTNDELAKNGLVSELAYKTSKVKEAELANRDEIEKKRLAFSRDSIEPQIASKQAAVDQAKQLARLKLDQVDALHVKAGLTGVLQQLPVQIGQRVKAGDNLARVADPTKLKAQVKIAETQAKDILIDQKARHRYPQRSGERSCRSSRSRGGTGNGNGGRGASTAICRKARALI